VQLKLFFIYDSRRYRKEKNLNETYDGEVMKEVRGEKFNGKVVG